MAASILAYHNYSGSNQPLNTDTIDIPSSKINNVKKSLKNILECKIKKLTGSYQTKIFIILKLEYQVDKQLPNNKTVLNLQGLHPESPVSNKNYVNIQQNTSEWEKLRFN